LSITIGDLLESENLGLSLRAGAEGLDRPIAWAHISETDDPAAWLEGGELLITNGMGVPAAADAQCRYIESLADRGVAGIAIGKDGHAPTLTAVMLRAADRLGFPVLEIPWALPFTAITKLVTAANDDLLRGHLLAQLRIFDKLQRAVTDGLGVAALVSKLEEVSGFAIYLLSPSGRPLLPGLAELPADTPVTFPIEERRSPFIPGGYAVPVRLSHTHVAVLVATKRRGDPADLVTVQYIAAIVALELATIRRERAALRREAAVILAEVLDEPVPSARMMLHLADLGFVGDPLVVVASLRGARAPADEAALDNLLCDAEIPHLLLQRDDLLLLLPWDDAAADVLARVPGGVSIGLGQPRRLGGALAVSRQEAQWSLERAVERGERMVRYDAEADVARWLPSDPSALRQTVTRILGPLIEYDRAHDSALLSSLTAFFEHDRQLGVAARSLSIHKHTLAYRLHNVERLTELRLGKLDDLIHLRLALHAHEALTRSHDLGDNGVSVRVQGNRVPDR
jgi:PucR family transcriptional regulator, purine catabolism regulatory protein